MGGWPTSDKPQETGCPRSRFWDLGKHRLFPSWRVAQVPGEVSTTTEDGCPRCLAFGHLGEHGPWQADFGVWPTSDKPQEMGAQVPLLGPGKAQTFPLLPFAIIAASTHEKGTLLQTRNGLPTYGQHRHQKKSGASTILQNIPLIRRTLSIGENHL